MSSLLSRAAGFNQDRGSKGPSITVKTNSLNLRIRGKVSASASQGFVCVRRTPKTSSNTTPSSIPHSAGLGCCLRHGVSTKFPVKPLVCVLAERLLPAPAHFFPGINFAQRDRRPLENILPHVYTFIPKISKPRHIYYLHLLS